MLKLKCFGPFGPFLLFFLLCTALLPRSANSPAFSPLHLFLSLFFALPLFCFAKKTPTSGVRRNKKDPIFDWGTKMETPLKGKAGGEEAGGGGTKDCGRQSLLRCSPSFSLHLFRLCRPQSLIGGSSPKGVRRRLCLFFALQKRRREKDGGCRLRFPSKGWEN